jgi:hypothetical protein
MNRWKQPVVIGAALALCWSCASPERDTGQTAGTREIAAGVPEAASAESLQVFDQDSVDVAPQIVRRGRVKDGLLPDMQQGGRVRAEFVVRPDSTAHHIQVTVEAGPEGLRDAAVETIRDTRFAPALKGGRPVPCRMVVFIDLKREDAP